MYIKYLRHFDTEETWDTYVVRLRTEETPALRAAQQTPNMSDGPETLGHLLMVLTV